MLFLTRFSLFVEFVAKIDWFTALTFYTFISLFQRIVKLYEFHCKRQQIYIYIININFKK